MYLNYFQSLIPPNLDQTIHQYHPHTYLQLSHNFLTVFVEFQFINGNGCLIFMWFVVASTVLFIPKISVAIRIELHQFPGPIT